MTFIRRARIRGIVPFALAAALAGSVGAGTAAASPTAAPQPGPLASLSTQLDDVARAVAPTPDPFYSHAPIAAGTPLGTVLRSEPAQVPLVTAQVPGVRASRILYVTTGAHGNRDAASAVVLVPPQRPSDKSRALIASGIADESLGAYCRPTSSLDNTSPVSRFRNSGPFDSAMPSLRAGHTVLVADLVNDGGPAPAASLLPRTSGHALLDGARAALHLPGTGLDASSTVALYGPSGGGAGAAAFGAELAPTYAPDLHIPAAVLGQIVPDHHNFIKANSGSVGAGFAFADLLGLQVGHPEMRIDEKLNPLGRKVAEVFRSSCTFPAYTALSHLPLEALFEPGHSPYAEADYRTAFATQALATPTSPTPTATLRITRCDSNLSPVSVTPVGDIAGAASAYRAAGADVSTRVVSCLGSVTDVYAPDLAWLLEQV
ncbi:lipase [Gordonia desulfuricans]|uniref:Lipase n=1 Tax=Gordonia desulfuricans TaxID=89051 RepID=A0A7K3LQZ9_9ACTN|nr:lipase family protein [Gordonia desulfuricans]NDK89977.1 lipase [Gordonia desulfuricans]